MTQATFEGFPSMLGDPTWPGAWKYGNDYRGDSTKVIAVHVETGDIKSCYWIGPVELTAEAAFPAELNLTAEEATFLKNAVSNHGNLRMAKLLEAWAENALGRGGYVHLFPADGDASEELIAWFIAEAPDEEEGK